MIGRLRGSVLLAVSLSVLLAAPAVWSFDIDTHGNMSTAAFDRSSLASILRGLGIDPLGRMNGGFLRGSRTPREWLEKGAKDEDDTISLNFARYRNHFYDPVNDRGLAGTTTGGVPIGGERALDWALEDRQEFLTQIFSFRDARQTFLTSLIAPAPGDREAALARTFETLGHVIHVNQDMASPPHTRNDIHGGFIFGPESLYEKYLDQPLVRARLNFNGSLIRFDLPRHYWASGDGRGLAEFTNRNFVSEGTNFTAAVEGAIGRGAYPNPVLHLGTDEQGRPFVTVLDIQTQLAAGLRDRQGNLIDGKVTFVANNFQDPITGQALRNDRMTTFSLFDRELQQKGQQPLFTLNRFNVEAQAAFLVPRAVGYSAGLLDYFFRGKLEVRRGPHPDTGEPSLRIVNRSPEPLGTDGVFSLYRDTDQGTRSLAVEWPKLVEAVPRDNDAAPVYLPVPADLSLSGTTLVYQGKLGSEENAVIGKGLSETRIERIYLDWRTNEWMLQTADKLYALPLKTVAGLRFRPAAVEWGERDNQIVAYTFWSIDTFQALLFEIERPLGSAEVPTTGAVTAQGHPVVALRLIQQVPLFETLGALDLGTTVEFTEHLDFTQYRVAFTVNSTCRVQDPPLFTYDTYNCASTFSDESMEPLRTLHDAVTARFPLALPRERFGWSPEWYAWNVQRVWADRNGHLVAAVRLQLAPLPGGESWRRFPLLTPSTGGPVESGSYASVQAKLEEPGGSVLAVVDLTAGRLLAKSSGDLIRIEKTQRAVQPSLSFPGCYLDVRGETVYIGGTRDGQREGPLWGAVNHSSCASSTLTGRLVRSLAAEAGSRLDSLEGLWHSDLAPLGPGAAEPRDLPPEPVYVRYGYESTQYGGSSAPVNLRVDRAVPVYLGPAVPSSWTNRLWWFGAAPGRLAFQADAREWSTRFAPGSGAEGVWLVEWDLEAALATSVYSDTGPAVAEAVSGNPYGVFLVNESDRTWRWVPWSGAPLLFPDRNPAEAWDYVALDATRLLNVRTGQLHRLAPGLPPDLEAAPFPPGGTRWDAYHILGR